MAEQSTRPYLERYVREMRAEDLDPNGTLRKGRVGRRKLLLYALATYHNRDTNRCDPAMQTLADDTFCTRRTVWAELHSMEQDGLITITRRENAPHQYTLTCLEPARVAERRAKEVCKTEIEVCKTEAVGVQVMKVGVQNGETRCADVLAHEPLYSEPLNRTPIFVNPYR